jgi:hypothetical protein
MLYYFIDQARAMELAIAAVLPCTIHRWCKWHVLKRATECLGPVYTMNAGFRDELHKLTEYMLTVDEFEGAWEALLVKYGLKENAFLTQIYEVREKWAKPYFADVFCARMTSTQRSESANHMLKQFVPPGSSMNMFVHHYNSLIFQRSQDEDYQEKRSRLVIDMVSDLVSVMIHHSLLHLSSYIRSFSLFLQTSVLLNTGGPIEKHASKIYTPAMYTIFGAQIFLSRSYAVEEVIHGSRFMTIHFDAEKRQRWARVAFEVVLDQEKDTFQCDCRMYEHMGMLCCHVIRVLLSFDILIRYSFTTF